MTKTRPWAELDAKIVADPVRRARVEEGERARRDGIALGRLRAELGLGPDEVAEAPDEASGDISGAGADEGLYIATLRS